jgi:hypothetical protein
MRKLNDEIKNLIVTHLARFRGYAEVARLVTDETGVTVDRFQVRTYDPTNIAYAGGDKWRSIFEAERHFYTTSVERVPISNQAYRLNELQRNYSLAREKGNLVLANATLEQAAKEVGNSLTNERTIRMNQAHSPLSELSSEDRRAMLADVLSSALERHKQLSIAN